ncbi:MAG: hypothetical protein H0T48_00915 [Gemmatimonadaceae bacterium]|nr:hypothetical protein [Gemmatimonadaceae bacterium]
MAVSRRWIAGVPGLWLALIVAEPPWLHLCAAHSAAHSADHNAARVATPAGPATGHSSAAHAAPHAAADVGLPPVEASPEQPPRCTCLGGFSHAGVFRLPESCEIVVQSVVIVEPGNVTTETPAVVPTPPPFLRPFSIGPPVLLAV